MRGLSLLKKARTTGILCAFSLLMAATVWGQFGVPLNRSDQQLEPVKIRELVAQYSRMDYAGARLSPADWPKIQPLVAWRTNPDFPLFMVTSRFDVSPQVDSDRGKYAVTVRYRLLGRFDLMEGYSQDSSNRIESVRYTVSEVNGEWRITEADPSYPHPSKAAALRWINQKLSETSDAVAKTMYSHALEALQADKSSPLAK
jgi:hypothetical protein